MPSQDADRHDKVPHNVTLKTQQTAYRLTARFHRAMAKFWQRSQVPHADRLVQVHTNKAGLNELRANDCAQRLTNDGA